MIHEISKPTHERLAARAVTSALLAGALVLGASVETYPDSHFLYNGMDMSLNYDHNDCLTPTKRQIAETTQLLHSPTNKMVKLHSQRTTINKGGIRHNVPALDDKHFRAWEHTIAKENSFSLADAPFVTTDIYIKQEGSPKGVFEATQKFASRFDLSLNLATSKRELDKILGSPVNQKTLWTADNAANFQLLQGHLEQYPTNFFKQIGIDSIVLMEGSKSAEFKKGEKGWVAGQVALGDHPHTIFLDYKSPGSLEHEVEHVVDGLTGCAGDDPQYTRLNKGVNIYAEKRPSNVYSEEGLQDMNEKRMKKNQPLLGVGGEYAVTDYSFTNTLEDKAEMGKAEFSPDMIELRCSYVSDVVAKKFALLFTRFRLLYPSFADLVLKTSTHCEQNTQN